MAEFLFEIGLEEIPARMIASAEAELERRVVGLLQREQLIDPGVAVKSFSTPRRLAVWIGEVNERQEDTSEEVLGPSAKIAYKEGVAGPAAVAFARKTGVSVEALRTVMTSKGEYLQATSVKAGRTAAEVIAFDLPRELAAIYWAKTMYWRAGKPERFVRPVRWLLAILGSDVVPVEFGGYSAGRKTFGHRVLFGSAPIDLHEPNEYESALNAAFVVPNVEARRHTIRKALDHICRTLPGMRWREDHALVDKLTHLTEWPSVIAGSFEPEFLALPEEVLVTVMRDHQSYFAVEDGQGKLAPHFLTVLNTQAEEAGLAVIRHGNERVLRARFNDARFFWEFDQRMALLDRVALLDKITFQKDLGSYAAKTARVRALVAAIASSLHHAGASPDLEALDEAARLAKTDLTTELVKEFTELQGQVGGLYGRSQGVSATACDAIYDQYRPLSSEDRIPSTIEGQLLATADKADTIAGMFSLGREPTGSKDPFALRRAANGIVKIQAEGAMPLDLKALAKLMACQDLTVRQKLESFFAERVEFYLREVCGFAYDVVKAVMSSGIGMSGPLAPVADLVARAAALTAIRGSLDFGAVSSAFKRMNNILAQALEKGVPAGAMVDPALLADPAEQALTARSAELAIEVAGLCARQNYVAALERIATLRSQVDAFFEAVMVMAVDEAVRANRLAILTKVLADFSGIADFAEIVVES